MSGQILEFRQPPSDPRWQAAKKYLSEQRYDKALHVFEDLAEDGFVGAYYQIGSLFESGTNGVTLDMEGARYWYMRAIEAGDDEAYVGMARLALNGYRDAGSFSDAAEYLWKACDKDNPRAMTLLGTLYHSGKGVEKESMTAARLYESAIAQGYVLPMAYLSKLRFEEGAYASGIWLRLETIWRACRLALKDAEDERLWNFM